MLYWYYQEERGTSMAYAKAIELNSHDVEYLQSLVRTRTIQAQVVDRAKMLLYKAQGESNRNIATRLDVNINTFTMAGACFIVFPVPGLFVLFPKILCGIASHLIEPGLKKALAID